MKVKLLFNDMNDDPVHEKELVYDNFSAPIPNVGDTVSIEGYSYEVKDRFFMYLSNVGIDLQIIFRCEKLK